MNLISIPAFQDNYIWLLADEQKHCVIVDPGESAPVLAALSQGQYLPQAILLTHHHNDHVGVSLICAAISPKFRSMDHKKPQIKARQLW